MSGVNKGWVCDCQPPWWGQTELKFGSPHLADDDNDGDDDAPASSMTPSWSVFGLCITIIVMLTTTFSGWHAGGRWSKRETAWKWRNLFKRNDEMQIRPGFGLRTNRSLQKESFKSYIYIHIRRCAFWSTKSLAIVAYKLSRQKRFSWIILPSLFFSHFTLRK